MTTTKSGSYSWDAIGRVVTGHSHIIRTAPCQDAISIINDPAGKYLITAIADGHGSVNCPFSAEGSQIAVETATQLLSQIMKNNTLAEAQSILDEHKEIRLPKQLELKWKECVVEVHMLKDHPEDGPLDEDPFPYILYGTTLAFTVVTEKFIFAMQIGDGDIVLVDNDKNVRWVVEPEYMPGNYTNSICTTQSWQHFRAAMVPISQDMGDIMLMLSTDGYSNCFADSAGFKAACADICKLWKEHGIAYIEERLEGWLAGSTETGSGDDIAMAVLLGISKEKINNLEG